MTVVDEHKWGEISYDDERRLPTRSYKSKQATETNPSAVPGGRTWLRVLSRPSFFFCIFLKYFLFLLQSFHFPSFCLLFSVGLLPRSDPLH